MIATAERRLSGKERAAVAESIWRRLLPETVGPVDATLNFLGIAKTLDEHAKAEAVLPFPICHPCARDSEANEAWHLIGTPPTQTCVCDRHGRIHKPYVATMIRHWHEEADAEVPVVIRKSRQILATWTFVAAHLHMALTRPGTLIAFQSENQTKANELIGRAEVMYRTLPRELQRFGPMSDVPKARARRIESEISFRHTDVHGRATPSRILAIPSGPHQVRSYTFTAILLDEAAHWDDFQESYYAALACVKGGGRMTIISTAGDSPDRFFELLCRGAA